MKRILAAVYAVVIGALISTLALAPAMAVDYKSYVGVEDVKFGQGTFTRRTSTGGLLTVNEINAGDIPWASGSGYVGDLLTGSIFHDILVGHVTGDNASNISGYDNGTFANKVTTKDLSVTGDIVGDNGVRLSGIKVLELYERPFISLTSRGLKCDGATDDTAAFTALMASLNDNGAELRVMDNEVCVFDSLITIDKNNIALAGWGHRRGTFKAKGGIKVSSGDNNTITGFHTRDLYINCNNQAAVCLDLDATTESEMVRTTVTSALTSTGVGIRVMGNTYAGSMNFVSPAVTNCNTAVLVTNGANLTFTNGNFYNDCTVFKIVTSTQLNVLYSWFENFKNAFLFSHLDSLNSYAYDTNIDHNYFLETTQGAADNGVRIILTQGLVNTEGTLAFPINFTNNYMSSLSYAKYIVELDWGATYSTGNKFFVNISGNRIGTGTNTTAWFSSDVTGTATDNIVRVTFDRNYSATNIAPTDVSAANWIDFSQNGYGKGRDLSAVSFAKTDLTTDNTWRDISFLTLVPQYTKVVHLAVALEDNVVTSNVSFRAKGHSNTVNASTVRAQVANILNEQSVWIPLDNNRAAQYNAAADDNTFTTLNITVLGWQ